MKTALIAEDDAAIGKLVGEALTEAGFQTHYSSDGIQAINDILELKPDVIVLDLVLPKLQGQEICAMIRKSPTVSQTAIIILSGQAQQEVRLDLFRLGADDFVSKPFQTDELVARVQAVYHRARHRAYSDD